MRGGRPGGRLKKAACGLLSAIFGLSLSGAANADEKSAAKPLPQETLTALAQKNIAAAAPIYMRLFKEESELEIWKAGAGGRFVLIKTFPVCNWSGGLGPKTKTGDYMAPEGFYGFGADGLKPDSKYHLALNAGYPNALDRALGRTGDFIMVHGKCVSVGCFAMTDDLIEEVYALARDAISGGEERVPLHIFPFRMTAEAMQRHAGHPAFATWAPLKEAFDDFARTQEPPRIAMCGKRYIVNPVAALNTSATDACPAQIGKLLAPLSPKKMHKLAAASVPLVADGPKTRTAEDIAAWQPPDAGWAGMMSLGAGPTPETSPPKHNAMPAIPGSMTPLLDAVK